MPPEECGPGFEADGHAGCAPILPEGPCARGQMAMPGEIHCREIAPCGGGDYGTIPRQDDPTTQFVNGAYPGDDSDGTRARPWKSIQDGILYARSGAVVAVAAGSYEEDIHIHNRPVQLWGRCPALVEVVGTTVETATLRINSRNANGAEVHSLAITGPSAGFITSGARDVVLDRVWIHDTTLFGVGTEDSVGASSFTVNASLVEATTGVGMGIIGSDATILATTVRGTLPSSDGTAGHGMEIQSHPATGSRSKVTIRGSLLEQNTMAGVLVTGADADIEATVVRDTLPYSDGTAGHGISIERFPATQQRASVTIRSSYVERSHELGVRVQGSDATIEATVVRDTQPYSDGTAGRGIEVHPDPATDDRASLTLRRSLLEQNHEVGVFVGGSDATIEATVIRATQPNVEGMTGYGVIAVMDSARRMRAALTLRGSLVEQNHDAGVLVAGADATVETTNVRATRANGDGNFGDGIAVLFNEDAASVSIDATTVENNDRAGISNFSAAVLLLSSTVQCNRIDLNGEDDVEGWPFTYDGSKGNLFGCGASVSSTMVVQSSRLSAPPPIAPLRSAER
ncbi:hypothetical protein [Sorangium sp. So ce131]|uniref:right-handed parallel beta-helix repeat-containing protein n=1 Tax=Sorangium sp. So ce131 TaxID=3133282 RepID=UPI003F60D3F3